jgi:hypothetical protein
MIVALVISAISLDTRMVLRHIDIFVPPVAHEIDRSAAGIIAVAVSAPVFRMTGRHAHVDRLIDNAGWHGPDHDGSRVNELRLRIVSDVDAAIKAGLADTDGHTDIGSVCRASDKGYHDGE